MAAALVLYCFYSLPAAAQTATTGESTSAVAPSPLLASRIENPVPPAGVWQRQRIAVVQTSTAPKIDGDLTDDCWRGATRAAGFYRFSGSAPITEQTEAFLCADDKNLYVAFHCLDSRPELIRISETQRGGAVWGDDHVVVHVDSQNTRRNTSDFVVSARGTQAEDLEGGTADNITWAGDWKAAARRVPDGWVAEMAIPFRLLRYPKGARSFGILLMRRLARETNPTYWPYLPPSGQTHGTKSQYLSEFTGFSLPHFAPRPTFLPYLLTTAGDVNSAREGLDIKYPLSTTLTAVASLFPDFKTVEQDVSSINFSYNEQFVPDRRPFFAEGAGFLPGSDLFYSRRIETVDQGFKVVGKSGPTALGLVTSTTRSSVTDRSSFALNVGRDIGQLHRLGMSVVGDNRSGRPDNRVARAFGNYGWWSGGRQYSVGGNHTQSWRSGRREGGIDDLHFRLHAMPGKPAFNFAYNAIAPNFISDLGLVPERNRRGGGVSLDAFNNFDRGPIEFYEWDLDYDRFDRFTGGFFRYEAEASSYVQTRRGWGMNAGYSQSARQQETNGPRFQDNEREVGLWWNQRTLFQGGGVVTNWGRQANMASRFISLQQNFLVNRSLTFRMDINHQTLGKETTLQAITTGTYRLSPTQTISGRLVRQDGAGGNAAQSVGVVKGTNVYFAYAQRVRSGADIFLLLGDPNSENSKGQVTLKLLRPY